jgi:hypothetical protein
MGITSTIKMLAALVIILIFSGGIWYVSGLRADLAISEENSKKMVEAVSQQQALIEQIQSEQKQIKEINTQLSATIKKQNNDLKELNNRFSTTASGKPRNFAQDAFEKPAAVERAINRGTVNAFRCLELASGAELTEKERNATKLSEINKECPSLANPNYVPNSSN